jgi:EAL domain-containing protein (putative c-di-GMP-specific phosphodiesterase class I)
MIVELGAWILDEACRLAASWPGHPIAVNISPRQLAEAGFVASVLSAIERHRIAPSAIVLEVTETVFLDTDAEVLSTLDELVACGVRIALDDFGTGYSSLNHLRQIPAQIVKVDRTYIADVGVDAGTTAIVEAVVGLTDRLGQNLIAEGIETEEQVAMLREMGVVLGQGYLLGHPLPAPAFLASVSSAECES